MSGSSRNAVLNCRFESNTASSTGYGGGVNIHGGVGDSSVIAGTHFCGNSPIHWSGLYLDHGGNTFADSCELIPGDLNGDGVVDVSDLLMLLAAWGECPGGDDDCPADLNDDGAIDVSDLLILLANWG